MNATQPTAGSPERAPAELGIRELLDVLTAGGCDVATFLASTRERIRVDPSVNWEVLSLLDQYYRRGKISKESFQELRIGLAEFALGLNNDDTPALRPAPAAPLPYVARLRTKGHARPSSGRGSV